MDKKIILQIIEGSFDKGFSVTVQISKQGQPIQSNYQGKLPKNLDIMPAYKKWQNHYYGHPIIHSQGIRNPRIEFLDDLTEVISEDDYKKSYQTLKETLEKWFNSQEMRDITEHILCEVYKEESVQLIISTDNYELQQLPWKVWKLFERLPFLEPSFSPSNF
ncbi:MAG: hypothetical protein AB4062_19245 [Crocosphaera sp.]